MAKKTQLGLVLRGKDGKKLDEYLSQSDKYNAHTKNCIDAAVSEYLRDCS